MVGASPLYRDGRFHNTVAATVLPPGAARTAARRLLFGKEVRRPTGPVPLVRAGAAPAEGLHLTWYGHASSLVELDGRRVLFDPVWSKRASPFQFAGPRRLHPPPVPLGALPQVDAIVISHDHYDHLDLHTVRELVRTQEAPFLVPLGVGAHLDRWRVPRQRIVELDWDDGIDLAGLRLTATAARHFSGRGIARDRTLWGSWVVEVAGRKVFYTGDSGYFEGYAAIGEQYGPFEASLIQIGAYSVAWPDIHMTPEDAVKAHVDLRAGLLLPVHWATFVLSYHGWSEPVERLWREAKAFDVRVAIPRPGERVDVGAPPVVDAWWQPLSG
ncbi:Zn-dependent hydrolase [Phytohabitans flavus]|uniref:Zn-dependent hydrolase n=1 Tax=Phytohabitans flavus TaxID=1076124 RepID=A0A6F8XXW1_9ACTN|nr:Zn-dependent hydrolase [Phytohabitans flavus]